jgi:hypothetical protein
MAYINGKEILFSPTVNYTDENPILEAEASRAQKELENMKALGVVETMQEDSTVAYKKTVPANALPYAEVKEVGGMTYVSKNIFNAMAVNKSNVVVTDNGANITVTGDPNGNYNSTDFIFEAGVYCATYGGTGTLCYVPAPAVSTVIESGVPFTITEEVQIGCLAFGANGGTFTNLMIVKGNTPADFAPYIEGGMASAAVTEIETVGYNILDLTPALNDRLVDNGDGTYTLRKVNGERFSDFFPLYIPKGQEVFCYFEIVSTSIDGLTRIPLQLFGADKNDNGASIGIANGGQAYAPTADTFFAKAYLQFNDAEGAYVTFRSPMIKYGKSAEFSPYSKHTYPIPAEVQALDGWGEGISADCHNRIVWDVKNGVKQYRQEVGIRAYEDGDFGRSGVVTNGIETVYALKEPIVTDLKDVLLDDNFIKVEGGGTVTAVNANGFDVHTTIEYRVKE